MVPAASHDGFSRGQESWAALVPVPGFIGQCGGFAGDHARVFGFWASDAAYAEFMRNHHDRVAADADQRRWYESISVDLFGLVSPMPGECGGLGAALGAATFVRLADCRVRSEAEDHFREVQATVWKPGMAATPGMLGGGFWRHASEPQRYLVLTLWANESAHAAYVATEFPRLRERAAPDADLAHLAGERLPLRSAWTVTARVT